MNIAECLTNSGSGGGQQLVFDLVRSLRRYFPQHRVSVVLPAGGIFVEKFRELGADVVEVALDRLSFGVQRVFSQAMDSINPDVVHSHGKGAGLYARLTPLRSARAHSFHGFHPPEDFNRANPYVLLERALSGRVQRYILVSESEKAGVLRALKREERKMVVIPNIIDVKEFRSSVGGETDAEFSAFASRNAGRCMVTMIGRSDPMKNHNLALGAARKILRERGAFAFAFIGLDSHFPAFEVLKEEYPERVFAIGYSPHVGAILKATDIVLHPSKREGAPLNMSFGGVSLSTRNYFGEGLPLALLEAQALGKPVVGTNVEGVTDVVEDGITGLLCDQTEERIATALVRLRNDGALYERMSVAALKKADESNMQAWAGKYMHVYEAMAAESKVRR